MKYVFVLLAAFIGMSYSLPSKSNGTFGGTVNGVGLIKLGRNLHKPMLTLIGMAIRNLQAHPHSEWTPWSSCSASIRGYFGSQTRTRSYTKGDISDVDNMGNETDKRLCEGPCPADYNLTSNGFCMRLIETEVSNEAAMQQCQLDGSYLINIDSQQKLDDVKPIVQGLSSYPHIDGRHKDATSPWQYVYGSESALEYQSLFPKKELCQVLNLGSFTRYDYRCSGQRPFLCEFVN